VARMVTPIVCLPTTCVIKKKSARIWQNVSKRQIEMRKRIESAQQDLAELR